MNKLTCKFYLVGIKGSGMAALASLLHDLGNYVMGSDKRDDFGFEEGIYNRNIKVVPFDERNIKGDYIYIISNAYNEENIEVRKIKENNFKYYYYQDFIATLKGFHIAVSGTHGKTTTTKMIVDLLKDEKIAYIVGDGTGGGVRDYKYLIYEACEYRDHFLSYHPDILVINNIELDHPDYFDSLERVYSSFEKMSNQSKIVITSNNIGIKKNNNFIVYGEGLKYDYQILEESIDGYIIMIKEEKSSEIFKLPFYGKHMIDNFMKAYLVLRKLGYSADFIGKRIDNLKMPKRRMEEEIFEKQIIIKDYAHHPTEIKALYDSLSQKYPKKKQIVLFQPHTYSRTLSLSNGFIKALDCFDLVYIFPTFSSARERKDFALQRQVNEVFKKYYICNNIDEIIVDNEPKIYIFLGAGEIHKKVEFLKEKLSKIY